jgi:hypothetical protein
VELDFRGFAFEGAAMGLALQDWLTPWNRGRLQNFLRGPGDVHAYMVHVGAGWVMARVPGSVEKFMSRFDPLLRWLLVDGYGFHEAFFHWPRYLAGGPVPKRLQGYARRVFDQGFGRCLWFVDGADVNRIAQTIGGFAFERQADLWSGVGLASVYAGEVCETDLKSLCSAAVLFGPNLRRALPSPPKRGSVRQLTPYRLGVRHPLRMKPHDAASLTDDALKICRPTEQSRLTRLAQANSAEIHGPTELKMRLVHAM